MKKETPKYPWYISATGYVIAFLPLSFTAIMVEGFALAHLWKWFAVPLGLPEVTLWHAAGLCSLLTLMSFPGMLPMGKDFSDTEKLKHYLKLLYVRPAMTLAIGAFINWMNQ